MLSRTVALPVIVGAAALKAARLRNRRLPPGQGAAFGAGTATSFASTLASQALIKLVERDSALWPYAAYRAGLAAVVLARHWRRSRGRQPTSSAYPEPATFATGDGKPPIAGNGLPTWVPATGVARESRPPGGAA